MGNDTQEWEINPRAATVEEERRHENQRARTVMYTYRPYMHPCVLPMHWQGQTSRECIVHSVSYAIRTMFSPLCLSKQCSAADVALAL